MCVCLRCVLPGGWASVALATEHVCSLPTGIAVEWDNGQKGTYFQKVLYMGDDVPAREETNYKNLLESRRVLEQVPSAMLETVPP